MGCEIRYLSLPCIKTGKAVLAENFCGNTGTVKLQPKHGTNLPQAGGGKFFHAFLVSDCCTQCEEVKVTQVQGDTVSIERIEQSAACFPPRSTLSYTSTTPAAIRAIVEDVNINVTEPLTYSCESRTIGINCTSLMESCLKGCGCG